MFCEDIFLENFWISIDNKYYLDLSECIVSDLNNVGLKSIKIDSSCTYDNKQFYSYRKNKGEGRMYSFITIL